MYLRQTIELGMTEEGSFTPEELTGRSSGHIVELAEPPCRLHRNVVQPFLQLRSAAAAAGIDLVPLSSFRDFDRQLAIWNGKHRGERTLLAADGSALDARAMDDEARVEAILHWSALPGTSRHHWGTDMDVVDANAIPPGYRPRLQSDEYGAGGVFARLDAWLATHAAEHGFYRPYATARGGVQPEPWHLSYAPLAALALEKFSVELLREALSGVELAARAVVERQLPAIVARYVRNIDAPPARATTSRTRLA
jgi:LAS superfamily LD-carboxypeptidase LdcB